MSIINRAKAWIAAFQESVPGQVLRRYGQDKCDVLAASVAFAVLFSMVPVILGVLAIVGLIVGSPEMRESATRLVLSTIPADSTESVLGAMDGISKNTRLFGLLIAFGVLSAGTSLFRTLEAAINQIYQVTSRALPRQVLLAIGLMLLFAVLVYVQLASATLVQFVGDYAGSLPGAGAWTAPLLAIAGAAISFAIAFAFSLTIYCIVPNLSLSVRHVLPGATLLSVGLVLLTQVFPLYIRYLSGFNQYGAILGLFFILLTWAHLVADFFLLGAELNAVLQPISTEKGAGVARPVVGSSLTPR